MNILTFDIEEWFLEKAYFGAKASKYAEYDRLLDDILQKLDENGLKGTFFCVGRMGVDFPLIVRKIADAGHEVGCHSNSHQWLNKMTYEQMMDDTRVALDSLEQCVGKKITSYRAPAFSIGSNNKWAFEVLVANGISKDASVFPLSRDFGGFPEFTKSEPSIIKYNGMEIHEFPIATTAVFGKEVAYSGGGYFRLFPYGFVEKKLKTEPYSMTYFHLGDLNPVISNVMSKDSYENYFGEPGTVRARYMRYLKTNLGVKGNKKKLFRLLNSIEFVNLAQFEEQFNWAYAPIVSI